MLEGKMFVESPEDGGQTGLSGVERELELELSVMFLSQLCLAQTLRQAGLHLGRPALQTPHHQAVAGPEPRLQVLDGAETFELAVDHDAQPRAESLALLHAVGGEHHRLPTPHHLQHGVPEEPPRPGVHP